MSNIKSLFRKTATPTNTDNISLDTASKDNEPTNTPANIPANTSANTPIEQTRWNGWGNININKKVSPHGAKLIKSHIGKTKKLNSVSLAQVLKTVPKSRLPADLTKLDAVSIDNEVIL